MKSGLVQTGEKESRGKNIDHEIISTVILLPCAESFFSYKRKYVHEVLVNRLFKHAQEKNVVRWTDRPAMTLSVDLGRKATQQTNKQSRGISPCKCDPLQNNLNIEEGETPFTSQLRKVYSSRFPAKDTSWFERSSKTQISLRIRADWPE